MLFFLMMCIRIFSKPLNNSEVIALFDNYVEFHKWIYFRQISELSIFYSNQFSSVQPLSHVLLFQLCGKYSATHIFIYKLKYVSRIKKKK